MASIFDLFTAPAQNQNPAPVLDTNQQPQPGNLPANAPDGAQQTVNTAANGVVPPQGDTGENNSDSPLDQFKDLWENKPDSESTDTSPAALDPNKLQEVISKADFSKGVNAEVLAKIAAGGEDATAAFAQAMNTVAQQVMLQSTLANNKLIEQQVQAAVESQNSQIPELLKKQALSNSLHEANPVFNNPAVKPVMEAVQAQLVAKNPNATPAELAKMTQDFVTVMGEALVPKTEPTANPNGEQNVEDWEKFLGFPG